MSDPNRYPGKVTRVLARPNLTHVGLQAELLVAEIDAHRRRNDLTPRDIADLHTMVANCLLFLGSGPPPTR